MADESRRILLSCLSEETPWEIRKQILDYEMTRCMSDAERAKYFGLPEGCRMRENAKIIFPKKLTIGRNCWIGEGAVLDASGGLEIGDNVSIGLGVLVWTHNSAPLNLDGINTREYSEQIKRKPTSIGSNCFISGPSVIMPGVTIGDECVISPMSVVYSDLAARTVFRPYRNFLKYEARIRELLERVKMLEARVNEKQGGPE